MKDQPVPAPASSRQWLQSMVDGAVLQAAAARALNAYPLLPPRRRTVGVWTMPTSAVYAIERKGLEYFLVLRVDAKGARRDPNRGYRLRPDGMRTFLTIEDHARRVRVDDDGRLIVDGADLSGARARQVGEPVDRQPLPPSVR